MSAAACVRHKYIHTQTQIPGKHRLHVESYTRNPPHHHHTHLQITDLQAHRLPKSLGLWVWSLSIAQDWVGVVGRVREKKVKQDFQ